jgi:hypothetical protein
MYQGALFYRSELLRWFDERVEFTREPHREQAHDVT